MIAVDQDPLGMQGRKVRDDGASEVWMKPLADGARAVILFNRGTEESTISAALGGHRPLPRHEGPRPRPLEEGRRRRPFDGRYEAKVEPHGVVMVKVTPQF